MPSGNPNLASQTRPQRTYVGVRGEEYLSFVPANVKWVGPNGPIPRLIIVVWENEQARILRLEPAAKLLGRSASDGLEWGYLGQGPYHLAVSILLEHTGDADIAQKHYYEFCQQVVGKLPRERFELSSAKIDTFLQSVS